MADIDLFCLDCLSTFANPYAYIRLYLQGNNGMHREKEFKVRFFAGNVRDIDVYVYE